MMFDGHDDPFLQATNQFLRRTDSLGKSHIRVMTLIRTEMKEVNCLETGCACDQMKVLFDTKSLTILTLKLLCISQFQLRPELYVMNSFINMKGINRNLIQ